LSNVTRVKKPVNLYGCCFLTVESDTDRGEMSMKDTEDEAETDSDAGKTSLLHLQLPF